MQGVFPECLINVAEVIPIHKKGDKTELPNTVQFRFFRNLIKSLKKYFTTDLSFIRQI